MKMFMFFVTLLIAVRCEIPVGDKICEIAKKNGLTSHTACLPKSQDIPEEMKKKILDAHNYYRKRVIPTASNMQVMIWDDVIADLAQRWAENCVWDHDENWNRQVMGYYSVGQNMDSGGMGGVEAVEDWFDEAKLYTYGGSNNNEKYVGHYTQLVWASSNRLGCGQAYCANRNANITVCNYAPAGNMVRGTPYKTGKAAAECPNKKTSDNLCDCGGKVCLNFGELNLEDCSCTCTGLLKTHDPNKDCKLNCPDAYEGKFSGNWCQYQKKDCNNGFSYVGQTYCPRTCNTCKRKVGIRPRLCSC